MGAREVEDGFGSGFEAVVFGFGHFFGDKRVVLAFVGGESGHFFAREFSEHGVQDAALIGGEIYFGGRVGFEEKPYDLAVGFVEGEFGFGEFPAEVDVIGVGVSGFIEDWLAEPFLEVAEGPTDFAATEIDATGGVSAAADAAGNGGAQGGSVCGNASGDPNVALGVGAGEVEAEAGFEEGGEKCVAIRR